VALAILNLAPGTFSIRFVIIGRREFEERAAFLNLAPGTFSRRFVIGSREFEK
jgi:hypothetical protein